MIIKSIKANNLAQLLLRYLAEVIIIFLGITFSFLFEQWREEGKQKKARIELSRSLLTDIEALKGKLRGDLFGSSEWISQFDSLRVQRINNKFSERQLTWFFTAATGQISFLFDPYSPTYMSALGTGTVNELPEHIRNQLYKLYRVQLPFFQLLYDQQQDNITNFRNTTMIPLNVFLYTNKVDAVGPDFNVLAKEILRPAYGNFINQIISTEKEVYKLNEEVFATLGLLETSLNEYIEQNS